MSHQHRRSAACVLSLFAFLALAACNTVSGIGQDLQGASDATRDAFTSEAEQPKTNSTNDGTRPEGG